MISHSEVKGQGVGCEVTWESYFDAEESQLEEISSMLQAMIKMNLEGIKNLF